MPKPLNLNVIPSVKAFTDVGVIDRWRNESASVQARAQDETTITIYDVIGFDWFTGEGFTVKRLNAALRSIGDKDITVNINSPGGDVFEGIAIYNELVLHSGHVTVNIVGMAASAASFIAMAGDTINIGKSSYIMIHEAMSGIYGTADEQQQVAEYTRKISNGISEIYAERGKYDAAKFQEMMAVGAINMGTFFNADEAIEAGLADGIFDGEVEQVSPNEQTKTENYTKREAEGLLTRAGMTRSNARSFLNKFGGTQDAAPKSPIKQDADGNLAATAASLIASLRST